MARRRSTRRPQRRLAVARVLLLVFVVAGAAVAGYQFGRPQPDRAPAAQATPSPSPTPDTYAAATPASAAAAAFAAQAKAVADAVLQSVPEPGSARLEREERRLSGSVSWKWSSYRVALQSAGNLKEATGAIVKAVEDAGGVLLVSRPAGRGQIIEFGLEVGKSVYPVIRVTLGLTEGSQAPEAPETASPRVAIIFDDAGQSLTELERIRAIDRPVTVSILPGLPQSAAMAREAAVAGVGVMLHLPMQPEDGGKEDLMGAGGVVATMSDEEISRVVQTGLAAVPGAAGVNNHMGSRGTQDVRVVRAVLAVLRARGLFFVDSMTSARSVAHKTALAMGIPTAPRTVFLDNDTEPMMIREQLRALIRVARERGTAIAIGHANRPNTAEVVREMISEIEAAGVRIVLAKALVSPARP